MVRVALWTVVLPAALGGSSLALAQVVDKALIAVSPNGLTCVGQPPGDSRDLFALEKQGAIRLVRDGELLSAPLLDISAVVNDTGEAGLLGLAFHPQFSTNGFFYICYSGDAPGAPQEPGVHIVRYTMALGDLPFVVPGSERQVFWISRALPSQHFGGWIGFGPDGYLYISSGDGAGDPQSLTSLGGKILRIDVDHDDYPNDPMVSYAAPPSNPFYGSTVANPTIWALGFRNPWRCSFDRVTGDLWIGDVGEATREEIDFQPAIGSPPFSARNYGWPCTEGTYCTGMGTCDCSDPSLAAPIYEYPHDPNAPYNAVLGGYVYRGSAIPSLVGAYVFGDIVGTFSSFRYGPGGMTDFVDLTPDLGPGAWAFGEDSSGELYYTADTHDPANPGFGIFKIIARCYANCDHSATEPQLNVNDFVCFQETFAAGGSYANCDGSTTPPVLEVNDFICFLNKYAQGCP